VLFIYRVIIQFFSSLLSIVLNLSQPIYKAPIYFVFLCDGQNAYGNWVRLCKLFAKALVAAMACAALAMCLQTGLKFIQ
jgi:hypothetical protein